MALQKKSFLACLSKPLGKKPMIFCHFDSSKGEAAQDKQVFFMVKLGPSKRSVQWLNNCLSGVNSFVFCINWYKIKSSNKLFDPIVHHHGPACTAKLGL